MILATIRSMAFITLLSLFNLTAIFAQDESSPDYIRNPKLPPFTLLKTDSSTLTRDDLEKDKQVLVILFSPQCGHCRLLTQSIISNMNSFKNIEILMTSFNPMDEMISFYNEFVLQQYSNIKYGRDTKYFFTPFFDAEGYPFLVLYNSKGKLITHFSERVPVDKILSSFGLSKNMSLKTAKN